MPYKTKEATNANQRKWYAKNKVLATVRVRECEAKRNQERRAALHALKRQPCTDCGECYPYYVMQFDHVRGEKLFPVGLVTAQPGKFAWQTILDEIAKCDLVCANCHAIRTHARTLLGPID